MLKFRLALKEKRYENHISRFTNGIEDGRGVQLGYTLHSQGISMRCTPMTRSPQCHLNTKSEMRLRMRVSSYHDHARVLEYSTRVLSGTAVPFNLLLVRLLIYYRIYMRVPVKLALVLATGPTVSRPGASGKTFAAPAASFPVTPLIYYRFYMRGPSRNQLPWARY